MLTYKLLTIFCVFFFIICRKLKKIYTYWERKGVKGQKPLWLIGNVLPILRKKETLDSLIKNICDVYPSEPAIGIYCGLAPSLVLKDPTLIQKVLIKDYTSFADRGLKLTEEKLFNSMFFEKGEKWKVYRQKFYPLFSTGRIKNILPDVTRYTDEFLNYIENLPPGPKELKLLDHKLSTKVTMSSFGLTVDTFKEGVAAESMEDDILHFPERMALGAMLYTINPKLPSAIGLRILPQKFVEMIIEKSKKAQKDNPHKDETDFDLMVKIKEQDQVLNHKRDGIKEIEITDSVLAGNIAVFLGASMEVYSNSSFLLFELALNQDIQNRCYKEIEQVMKKYNGDLTLEAINELQYVNMAFDESLRMYPNGGALFRVATKDYHFEDIDVTIEKGVAVIIPVQAIHYDPKNYYKPEVFNPDRFSVENKKNMQDCSYLPFGDGPRKCIGFRLARVQSILLIAKFLHRFKVTPCEKTVSPVRMVPLLLSLYARDGLWVNISKRQ